MKTLEVNGVELAVEDRGSGPVLLLVHGFPLDHTMWNAQIEALSDRCRVIAPDLRGFGRSGVTDGTVTMEQFADDMAGLIDALEIAAPIVFCGLSMGGYVAWQFWKKYTQRVRGLILCDTRAIADTPEVAAGRRETAERVVRQGPESLADTMMPKLLAEAALAANPRMAQSLRRMILSADAKGIAAAARGMAERPDVTSMLGGIHCPTLVVVGRFDAISTPSEMRSIADAIPDAHLVEIAGAGHMSPMENPAGVNAAIMEFLAGLKG